MLWAEERGTLMLLGGVRGQRWLVAMQSIASTRRGSGNFADACAGSSTG